MPESHETNPLKIAEKYSNLSRPELDIQIYFAFRSMRDEDGSPYIMALVKEEIEARKKGDQAMQIIQQKLTDLATEVGMKVVHRAAPTNSAAIAMLRRNNYEPEGMVNGRDFETFKKTFYPK